MMSKKQWFVLLCIYIMYLLAGAAIFYYIEAKEEHITAIRELQERKNLELLIREHFQGNYSARKFLFASLTEYCGKPLNVNMGTNPYEFKWDFYHSLFFVITVVSTIGYGNLSPTTMFTRIFMIFYALVGIPMNGIVIYTLGDFFAKSFRKLHERWKNSRIEQKFDYETAKLGLIGQVILYLIPGFTFFIFLPSTIMSVFEGWPYYVSVYYCFVSLTTIGFGDFVAGVSDIYGFGLLYTVYQIFLLVWIIGGMGYVVMILSYITNGMRSKKIKQFEHILSENIKNTPKKLRIELSNLLHEMLFMRVKPVYKGEFEYVPSKLEKTQSCPDLTIYIKESPSMIRKRAMSECYRSINFQKVQSDTDLNRIDKERTFMPTNDLFNKTELLFKVCDALSNNNNTINNNESLHQARNEGIHGFSDESILASEFYKPRPKTRRAVSDIRPPKYLIHEAINGNTWYGADAEEAIQEYRKRTRAKSVIETNKNNKTDRENNNNNLLKRIRNRFLSRDESSHHQEEDVEKQNNNKLPPSYYSSSSNYNNKLTMMREQIPNLFIRRESLLASAPRNNILEDTSIAEFIRALSAISSSSSDALDDSKSSSSSSPSRSRRPGIVVAHSRRASLIPDINNSRDILTHRRFSLRPVDENLLKDLANNKSSSSAGTNNNKGKNSVSFQTDERRGSLSTINNCFPTVEEGKPEVRLLLRENSPNFEQPPPYSSISLPPQRKFSVRQVISNNSALISPVQKQLQKRDRTDSVSSNK